MNRNEQRDRESRLPPFRSASRSVTRRAGAKIDKDAVAPRIRSASASILNPGGASLFDLIKPLQSNVATPNSMQLSARASLCSAGRQTGAQSWLRRTHGPRRQWARTNLALIILRAVRLVRACWFILRSGQCLHLNLSEGERRSFPRSGD